MEVTYSGVKAGYPLAAGLKGRSEPAPARPGQPFVCLFLTHLTPSGTGSEKWIKKQKKRYNSRACVNHHDSNSAAGGVNIFCFCIVNELIGTLRDVT